MGQEPFPTKYLLQLIVKSFNGVSFQQEKSVNTSVIFKENFEKHVLEFVQDLCKNV